MWCQHTEAISQISFMLISHKFSRLYHRNVTQNIMLVVTKMTFDVKTWKHVTNCVKDYNVNRKLITARRKDGIIDGLIHTLLSLMKKHGDDLLKPYPISIVQGWRFFTLTAQTLPSWSGWSKSHICWFFPPPGSFCGTRYAVNTKSIVTSTDFSCTSIFQLMHVNKYRYKDTCKLLHVSYECI